MILNVSIVLLIYTITVPQDPQALRQSIREVTACLIASGIDPEKSILFNQSTVPHHAELGWIFNCVARLGWLNRMTQFKEKQGKIEKYHSRAIFISHFDGSGYFSV